MRTVNLPFTSDVYVVDGGPTTTFDNDTIYTGEALSSANVFRTLIKPDYSAVSGITITSAILKMTPVYDDATNTRTMYAHRVLRSVNYSQVTWNQYSTGNNWGTAGCGNSSSDYDGAVILGSATQFDNQAQNNALGFQMTLDASEINKFIDGTYTNNGIVLFLSVQSSDLFGYASTDHATSAWRPVITVTYAKPDVDRFFMFYPMRK